MDRIIFFRALLWMTIIGQWSSLANSYFGSQFDSKEGYLAFYINSPGGSFTPGLGTLWHHAIPFNPPEVEPFVPVLAASMGMSCCRGAGRKKRHPGHIRIMIHNLPAACSQSKDSGKICLGQILDLSAELYEILANHSGKTIEGIEEKDQTGITGWGLLLPKNNLIDEGWTKKEK